MKPLILKTLRDKRWVMLGWVLGMVVLCVFTISFFPTFSKSNAFDDIVKNLPSQFQGLLGDADTFRKLPNFIGQQVLDFRLPLFTAIFAVVMAINLSASEEESGTLKTLQSLPISRRSVVLAKWISLAIITGVVTFSALPGIMLGVVMINGQGVNVGDIAFAITQLWLLSFGIAAFGFMVGFATGRKPLTVAAASLFAAYNIFLAWFAPSVDWLQEAFKYTLYYYFNNPPVVVSKPDWAHLAVLAGAPIVFGLVGMLFYQNRDIDTA